jgi:hypothetical protein
MRCAELTHRRLVLMTRPPLHQSRRSSDLLGDSCWFTSVNELPNNVILYAMYTNHEIERPLPSNKSSCGEFRSTSILQAHLRDRLGNNLAVVSSWVDTGDVRLNKMTASNRQIKRDTPE